jgi:GAF domain-containing protein
VPEFPDDLVESLLELNRLIVEEESLSTTLQRIAEVSCRTIRGCDNCGLTLEQGGEPTTVAHTGDKALPLDHAQYAAGRGPCLDSYREQTQFHLSSIGRDARRWPEFTAAADRLGIESSLSIPLLHDGDSIGALNLYSGTEGAFDRDSVALAEVYSAQAAVVIRNARVFWKTVELTKNLQTALQNRDVIGQAKGIQMARTKITSEEAFARLRQTSQELNRKLVDVATHVVRTGELPRESMFD